MKQIEIMKGLKLFTGLAALGLLMSLSLHTLAGENYKIADKSKVTWLGKKVTGQHTGDIVLKSGELSLEKGMLTGGTFIMDMTSITCTDMEGEYADKLLGHLKSDDFFGVTKNKTSKLIITKVATSTTGIITVSADLTIKGITKKVEFPVVVDERDGAITVIGVITVNRTLYGIKYGSGSFFDDLGDKMIEDNFTLTFNLTAKS